MQENGRFLTIRETARLTGVSEYFLRKNIKEGIIPVIMCGNRAKLTVSMLMEALKAQSVKNN